MGKFVFWLYLVYSPLGIIFLSIKEDNALKYQKHWGGRITCGNIGGYCICCSICCLSVMTFAKFYSHDISSIIFYTWGNPESWHHIGYLKNYRPWSYPICKAGFYMLYSEWFSMSIVLGMLLLWFAQKKFKVLTIVSVFAVSSALIMMLSFVRMLMMPLGF